jgi:gamma-glutamylcyclotransferase (GGCT)/AIG2-like uncharacterized protein YtfP
METGKNEFLGVYGTLRRRSLFQRGPRISAKLRFFGSGQIRGKLFWQGDFPAAVPGRGIIPVEIFQILDSTIWNDLDRYEGCDFADESSSLFHRKKVPLLRPVITVWVYFLGHRQFRGKPLSRKRSGSRWTNIVALSDVASGFSDDDAKSEIAGNGKRRARNAKRIPYPRTSGAI